jgi:hypothetical protein
VVTASAIATPPSASYISFTNAQRKLQLALKNMAGSHYRSVEDMGKLVDTEERRGGEQGLKVG